MMVFICTNADTDPERSAEKAMGHARFVYSLGLIPCVTQALLWQWHAGGEERMKICEEAIACCDEVWTFEPPDGDTRAMMGFARTLRMPVCRVTGGGRREYMFNRDMVRRA